MAFRTLLIALPLFASASAFAQPGDTAVSDPAAPQNASWSNVSNINGQIVPVGQHNDYLYTFRRINVASDPAGWLAGVWGLSISYAVNNHVALRADGNLFHDVVGTNDSGYEIGISAPIYLRRTYQGPFLEPGLIARSLGAETDSTTYYGPEMLVGYHWMFDDGLNLAIAGGLARMTPSNNDSGEATSGLQPAGYLRFGYAF